MKLSLCMIARDQAGLIGQALDSVDGVVDEKIVVDTGSSDGTDAVARAHGATVVPFVWDDDYAAARNAALDAASGEWILFLDCDERLCESSKKLVREAIESPGEAEAFFIDLVQHMESGVVRSKYLRLGKPGGRRFVRRIHELVDPPFTRLEYRPIEIEHIGNRLPGRPAKLETYVRILRRALEDDPGDLYIAIDLMYALRTLKDPAWREEFDKVSARMPLHSSRPPNPLANTWLEVALRIPTEELPPELQTSCLDELAERWGRNSLPLLSARALHALKAGDPLTSARLGERAIALWDSGNYEPLIAFEPSPLRGGLHMHQGIAFGWLGWHDQAQKQFQLASQFPETAQLAIENAKRFGLTI